MRKLMLGILFVGVTMSPCRVGAQEQQSPENGEAQSPRQERAPAGSLEEEARRLHTLKDEHPEEFQRVLQDKRAQLRERLSQLQTTNPEAYQRVQDRLQKRQRERLEGLRRRHPGGFTQARGQRRERLEQRLNTLKETDPQRYHALQEKRQAAHQAALERFQQRHPEAYSRFMQNHPEVGRVGDRVAPAAVGERRGEPRERRESLQNGRPSPEGVRERLGQAHPDRTVAPSPGSGLHPGPSNHGVRDRGRGEGRAGLGQGGQRRNPKAQGTFHRGGARRR